MRSSAPSAASDGATTRRRRTLGVRPCLLFSTLALTFNVLLLVLCAAPRSLLEKFQKQPPLPLLPPSPSGATSSSVTAAEHGLSTCEAPHSAATAALARDVAAGGLARLGARLKHDEELFVTFGNSALAPFVSNLLSTLAQHGVSNILVGALDAGLHEACVAACVPAVRIDEAAAAGDANARSEYIRKDYSAFKKMGTRKVGFLAQLLAAVPHVGVWVCDADVAFLRPPHPSLLTAAPALASADVFLSTDCLDLAADERGECPASASLNTGVLYLRAGRAGAVTLVRQWHDRMLHVGPEPWLDDQAVLNELIRDRFVQLPPLAAVAVAGGGSRTYTYGNGSVTVGFMPLAVVANGHSFFVQHPQAMCARSRPAPNGGGRAPAAGASWCGEEHAMAELPVAVHATYQYGDTGRFAYGKRDRMMQAGLWLRGPYALNVSPQRAASTPNTDNPQGASNDGRGAIGRGAEEEERYVVIDEAALDAEMHAEEPAEMARGVGGGRNNGTSSPDLLRQHKRADAIWRRRVLALLAVAIATNRTAVLPPALCYCDAFWGGLVRCRVPAAQRMALPFECPIDHIIDLPRWHAQRHVAWRPPRFLQHYGIQGHARGDRQKLVLAKGGLDEVALRAAGIKSGSGGGKAARVYELALPRVESLVCGFQSSALRATLRAAASLLRYTRLFCHVEGSLPGTGEAAPCCTEHSLRTGWTTDEDPRGKGFLPCGWGFEVPESLPGGDASGTCVQRPGGPADADADDDGGVEGARAGTSKQMLLAACVLPSAKAGGDASDDDVPSVQRVPASAAPTSVGLDADDAALLGNWIAWARKAGQGAADMSLQVVSSDARAALVARQANVSHVTPPSTLAEQGGDSSWAYEAAGCVSHALEWLKNARRAVILSTTAIVWLHDPTEWVSCEGTNAGLLQCAPLGPADAMVATEMLSERQDALFGGGHAKWGALDPSILVLRPTTAGRALAAAWRDALLAEHRRGRGEASGGAGGWNHRASTIFRELIASPTASSPGLEEQAIIGVRQPSRLFEASPHAGGGLLGILPLALFRHGHSHWVQRGRQPPLLQPSVGGRQRWVSPTRAIALRPHLLPLSTSYDTAAQLRRRLAATGLWLVGASDAASADEEPSPNAPLLLALRLPEPAPLSRLVDAQLAAGVGALQVHGRALGWQLRALRAAAAVARALSRALVRPTVACYCDRDPSATITGLLTNGCRLPSGESEAYLPHTCPMEHVIDESRWQRLARTAPLLVPKLVSDRASVDGTGASEARRVEVRAGETVAQLASRAAAAAASSQPSAKLIELVWPSPTLQLSASREHPAPTDGSVEAVATSSEVAMGGLLARGPRHGWCASTAHVRLPPDVLALGVMYEAGGGAFCFNVTQLMMEVQ